MPVGLGSVLSQGLQGAVGGYQGAIDHQYDRVSKALQLQNLQYQASQNGLLNDIIRGGLSGQQGSQAAAGQPAAPQSGATGIPVLDAGGVPAGTSDSGQGATSMPVPAFGYTPQGSAVAAAPQPQSGAPAPQASGGMFGGIPPQQAALAIALGQRAPALAGAILDQYKPTDIQKQLISLGYRPGSTEYTEALKAAIKKEGYIAPVAGRPGASLTGSDGVTRYNLPAPQPGAMWATNQDGTLIYNQAGQPYQIGIAGAAQAAGGMAYAKTAGEGGALPYSGLDAQGNPLPITNRTTAATGGAFGNQPPPIPTLPGLGGAPAQSGSPVPLPGGPLPGGMPAGAAAPSGRGAMYAAPPMGAVAAANAAQAAPSKQMADSYKGLSDSDSSYQQSRGALTDMLALANQMGPIDSTISKLPEGSHNWDSTVASYDKAHSTFVSNQYNALSAGTDSSKGTVDSMIPSSDKPLDTKIHGLNMQLNNLDYRHLETQLMTPSFQGGNQGNYTSLNAQFHNTVKPEMMPVISPILQMGGAQQQAAVQAAVKANPALRPAFETLFTGGMLK
jgi:hypothetical protein